MIFSVIDHIKQIIDGTKTQTRRQSDFYQVGLTYAIQPKRTSKAIPQGRILITDKKYEQRFLVDRTPRITKDDAEAEGGYTPEQFEKLYDRMHPFWMGRWAYTFKFISTKRRV